MPRPKTRSKSTTKFTASVTRRVNYAENSDTSDDNHDDPLTNLLGLIMNFQRRSSQKKKRKSSSSRASKRKQSVGGCDCPNCETPTQRKKNCTTKARSNGTAKAQPKGKAKADASTSSAAVVSSDDDEVVGANITEAHVDTIRNNVDKFFKCLDSDDDELESKLNTKIFPSQNLTEKKSKDFYTILSDSEDEKEKPSTSANNTNSFSEPGTSGFSNCISSGLKFLSQTLNTKIPEKLPEDLFAYVDHIINDCNVIDITADKPKENAPVESLEDLKKQTEEILGDVTSLIDDLKPKPKEPEKNVPESPMKEAPICPICLETLGGPRQAMATFCGHIFCEPCIAMVAKTSKKCPTCRKGVNKKKYHAVYI